MLLQLGFGILPAPVQHPSGPAPSPAVEAASAVLIKCFTAKALADEAAAVGTPCSATVTIRVRMMRLSTGARTVAAAITIDDSTGLELLGASFNLRQGCTFLGG